MRILFVLENYYPNIGGVETLFKNLVERLAEEGNQITIVTTKIRSDLPFKEELKNITIVRVPFWNRYFFTLFAVFPVFYFMKNSDIVHTTSYNAGLPAFFAAKLRRKKIIITFHEVWGQLWFQLPYMNGLVKWGHYYFEQLLLKLPFDRFIAVSESTAESLRKNGVAPEKVLVNYNGIDYTEFKNILPAAKNEKEFTYTYFGRLGISKGLDILLDAAEELKKNHTYTRLKMIIPKEPAGFFDMILKIIKERELENYIHLLHHLSFQDLLKELKASDCIVIPSYSEGFCYAAVESIALEVPIISSDQAALREVVSGKYIKMKEHSSAALVAAILQAKNGEWQNDTIKRFELADSVQGYLNIYKNELSS